MSTRIASVKSMLLQINSTEIGFICQNVKNNLSIIPYKLFLPPKVNHLLVTEFQVDRIFKAEQRVTPPSAGQVEGDIRMISCWEILLLLPHVETLQITSHRN